MTIQVSFLKIMNSWNVKLRFSFFFFFIQEGKNDRQKRKQQTVVIAN